MICWTCLHLTDKIENMGYKNQYQQKCHHCWVYILFHFILIFYNFLVIKPVKLCCVVHKRTNVRLPGWYPAGICLNKTMFKVGKWPLPKTHLLRCVHAQCENEIWYLCGAHTQGAIKHLHTCLVQKRQQSNCTLWVNLSIALYGLICQSSCMG